MAQILVRNLEPEVVDRLKGRARSNGHSLQAEVAHILREAAETMSVEEAAVVSERWHAHWQATGKTFSDSTDMIREDRDNDHGRD